MLGKKHHGIKANFNTNGWVDIPKDEPIKVRNEVIRNEVVRNIIAKPKKSKFQKY
jgi:hypothetical protein